MSYGLKLVRDDGTPIIFNGLYNNFRVLRTEIVEHRAGPQYIEDAANYNSIGPSTSAFSCAEVLEDNLPSDYLLFRRFISMRSEPIGPGVYLYYVKYKYLICERSTSEPSGYGAVIYDSYGNIAFNSADAYTQVYDIRMTPRYSSFNIPTPPAGMYSYCSVSTPGQLVYVMGDFNGAVAYYQTTDVTATKCLVGRNYLPGLDNISTLSKSPHIYPSKAAAESATQSIAGSGAIQVMFAAYKN